MQNLLKSLKNPPKQYRGLPFWSWNEKLDPDILRRQIVEMDKAGLGGYFMHARGGLQTEYLGEDWMECIGTCIDEGEKHGMGSWCYDEEGWPSGFAGGRVTALGDSYRMRWIDIEETGPEEVIEGDNILGLFVFDPSNGLLECIKQNEMKSKNSGCKFLVVSHKSNPYYIDILNEKVVKAFIEVTHEEYYKRFGNKFGKAMPGFFTDEPQFAREHIPWSYVLPEVFHKKFGYDPIQWLPALFIECRGYEKFRYDYWSLVNTLYVESFGKQVYDWCEEHNCKLTGHSIQEDGFLWQMYCSAGVMPFYEYMHIPGIDWLCRRIDSPMVPKQVSSAANQLGKQFVLTETFAACGWDLSFEEMKWMAEWQFVNGVNIMCGHLEGYSLRGFRKRDYPPSLFYQQSWWEEYKYYNDYFARLSTLLTSGRGVCDVLLLHPMKSVWISYNFGDNGELDRLEKDFISATEALAGLHADYHYGDETIIGKYGSVQDGKFTVGRCRYKAVIIPSMLSLDEQTLELLNLFIDNGGKVASMGEFPEYCCGISDSRLKLLRDRVVHIEKEGLRSFLYDCSIPNISICDNNGENASIHCQQRDLGNARVFFLVNHNRQETFDVIVSVKGTGSISKYFAEDSRMEVTDYYHEGGCTKLKLEFLPIQSHIVIFDTENKEKSNVKKTKSLIMKTGDEWIIEDAGMNSLTLDYCSYSIDEGDWKGPVHTIKLMDILLKMRKSCEVALKFTFEVETEPGYDKEFYLAIEKAEEFDMYVNGKRVEYKDIGWWKDLSFKKVDVKEYIINGTNEVILRRRFYQSKKVYDVLFGQDVLESEVNKLTYDVELESIYVVGDFGVISKSPYSYGARKAVFTKGPFVITDRPQKVGSGNLTEQGFCFFAGSLKLSQNIYIVKEAGKKVLLDIGKPDAAMLKVSVNDLHTATLLWSPYCVDITNNVRDGNNKITIELFSSNRNLLGPHHHKDGELFAVGPDSFKDNGDWSDSYCFVKFGLKKSI